jgi:integrase
MECNTQKQRWLDLDQIVLAEMRNPNGYGSVFKLSGRRRKPFIARKTVGYDDRGYPIYSVIGYYETRSEAMIALANFNGNPYNVNLAKLTFKQLYSLWSAEYFPKMKPSSKRIYAAAFRHSADLYDLQYSTIRKLHFQRCIDACDRGVATKGNMKLLYIQLDKYAYDQDIITKQFSKNLTVGSKTKSEKHRLVTDDEVKALWDRQGQPYVDDTLFMLYTGCRLSEMLQIRCRNVNLDDNTMIGGLKTEAGTNRVIPIHDKILPIVKQHLSGSEYLFNYQRNKTLDDPELAFVSLYTTRWKKAMKEYGFNHLTHDCRHTFISKLDAAGANKVSIDRIVGHVSKTIGERVYTHKTVDDLHEAIRLLSY